MAQKTHIFFFPQKTFSSIRYHFQKPQFSEPGSWQTWRCWAILLRSTLCNKFLVYWISWSMDFYLPVLLSQGTAMSSLALTAFANDVLAIVHSEQQDSGTFPEILRIHDRRTQLGIICLCSHGYFSSFLPFSSLFLILYLFIYLFRLHWKHKGQCPLCFSCSK